MSGKLWRLYVYMPLPRSTTVFKVYPSALTHFSSNDDPVHVLLTNGSAPSPVSLISIHPFFPASPMIPHIQLVILADTDEVESRSDIQSAAFQLTVTIGA